MHTRLRTTGAAGAASLLLVLAIAGTALAAPTLAGETADPPNEPPVETALTWEDADGDGIDDDCDDAVVADPAAALASDVAADADGDGTVSVDEAARTERVGGPECNHGGYVSGVAAALGEADEAEDPLDAEEPVGSCEAGELPPFDPAIFNGPGAFGAYVASVAALDVDGGTNCNHGGAVRAAVHAAKDAARDARAAERAERAAARAAERVLRDAERDAAQAERAAERAAAKAERAAAKAERAAARAAEKAERAAKGEKAERSGGKAKGK